MEKPHKISQIYGYAVCLVCIITILISVPNVITSLIDLSDPMHAGSWYPAGKDRNMASYELYKVDILSEYHGAKGDSTAYVPDEATILSMFEAAKADKIQSATHIARRTVIVFTILTAIAVVLFIIHFRWMRALAKAA